MFELAAPWVLVLLPLPLIFWYLLPRAKVKLPTALKVPFFDAMVGIVEQEKRSISAQSLLLIPALIWLLLVFALAGPRWVGEPRPVARDGYNIMMVLDLSGSMEINDMLLHGRPTSRLNVVKRAAEQFVQDRVGDRIGLILFGTRAYLQTPLTYDRHSVLMRIEDATAGLAGKTTSIGDAVGLAVKRLENVPNAGRVIILLTDGANNSGVLAPLKAAELAKDDGIKIYTIGLGSEADPRALSNDFLIMNASADLDEDTLKKMAAMTGGRYFRATDTETLQAIYKTINELETASQEQATIRPQKDYYPWFVGFALLLCFYWMVAKADLVSETNSLFQRREEFKS
ncbi:VWA domain-containing protein [Legionella maioricensis]|uniref:VWA domain-containing protein n=1 Tax=Legionella maioricensis TaxID=2896528 RepID=A0A9X2CYB5_9GAMM|nr:VWA domain-containing protein [Legionella maioricensis]MCL9682949.1 VWA domain-containing protein [Legionella maioricensis]MCL9686297.1 VWA domain-containing protein [Legionella maioricensis]